MRVAEDDLKKHWARVVDVSATESYDFLCTSGESELRVEVKGTTGLGLAVVLTRNEVTHAKHFPAVALYVVSGIQLSVQGGGVTATGGSLRVLEPWKIAECELDPIAFECFLPSSSDLG